MNNEKFDILFNSDIPVRIKDGGTSGGSENTLEIVCKHLVTKGKNVGIVSPIEKGEIEDGVHFLLEENWLKEAPMKVFMRRKVITPLELKTANVCYSWCHDYITPASEVQAYAGRISVSRFLEKHNQQYHKHADDKVIWNPVNPKILSHKKEKRSGNSILWTSAFMKGIQEALNLYMKLTDMGMKKTFNIIVPEWSNSPFPYPQILKDDRYDVNFLGSMKWEDSIEMLSTSACLFRPGMYPETFGLIYAEASSLGVPTLTFDMGAAREVLGNGDLILDEKVELDDVMDWIDGVEDRWVTPNPDYGIDRIVKKWIKLIEKAG